MSDFVQEKPDTNASGILGGKWSLWRLGRTR